MSSSPSSTSRAHAAQTSFTTMDEKDPSLVGVHCQYSHCGQLDFLPFRCESCRGTYCLDHRTEDAHACSRAGEWAARRRRAEQTSAAPASRTGKIEKPPRPCASPLCKTVVGTSLTPSVHCSTCNRDYCLKHRMREEHDCQNLVPIGARAPRFEGQQAQAKTALARLRAWGSAQKDKAVSGASRTLPRPKPSTATARLLAVNQLKKTAKGDDKVPAEKRVYVTVEAEAATTTAKYPHGAFFYSQDWALGRVLDAAAKALQIANVNNQSTDEKDKIRVFHVEEGRLLGFSEKVGDVLVSGNTIVLLRGVGPPEPDLIDLSA